MQLLQSILMYLTVCKSYMFNVDFWMEYKLYDASLCTITNYNLNMVIIISKLPGQIFIFPQKKPKKHKNAFNYEKD